MYVLMMNEDIWPKHSAVKKSARWEEEEEDDDDDDDEDKEAEEGL